MNDYLTVSMWDIEISEHSEFGKVFKWRCPECGKELRYYEGAPFANELDCHCGLHWELVFFAQGREKDG